jgi:8-oxo-dGTP pyrophosphatase MutT (NUDIX family)
MPSAYCVVFARNQNTGTQVFVVRKSAAVPNNPGQLVFPGGRMNQREAAGAAAAREFHEETHVQIDLAGNRVMTTKPVAIVASHVVNFVGYSALYVEVGSGSDLLAIKADVKINIKNHQTDGEIADCDVMTKRQAHATMKNEDQPHDARLRTDWFVAISDRLP